MPYKIRRRIAVQPCKLRDSGGPFYNDHHKQHRDSGNDKSLAGLISISVVRWKEYEVKYAIDHQTKSEPGKSGINAHRIVFHCQERLESAKEMLKNRLRTLEAFKAYSKSCIG